MKITKFKTSIKSEEMAARIGPFLNSEDTISQWDVDLDSDDKILSVSGKGNITETIQRVADYAGFKAEMLETFALDGRNL